MTIRDMHLRSGASFPDAPVVDHRVYDAKFTSEVFRASFKSIGWCLIVCSAYHKNTNRDAKVERANSVIGDAKVERANGVIAAVARLRPRTQGRLGQSPDSPQARRVPLGH